jgi:hypothetical protein
MIFSKNGHSYKIDRQGFTDELYFGIREWTKRAVYVLKLAGD